MSTRARLQPSIMPPAVLYLKNRLAAADRRYAGRFALLAAIHLAAFGVLLWSEDEPAARAAFVLTWGALNFFWLVLLRRPLTSAALSLALIVILIALSQFKHGILMMTATFVDVMLIDVATFWFFLKVNPGLVGKLALAAALAMPVMVLLWRTEPFRVHRGTALLGCRCGRRPDERRRVGGRSRDCGPVEPRDRRSVPPGPQAAAHRHGVRRVELRRHHDARCQSRGELPRAVSLIRRKDPRVRGR